MNQNREFMEGFQDKRKVNSDPETKPKNVKAHLLAKGENYRKGWLKAKGAKYPDAKT